MDSNLIIHGVKETITITQEKIDYDDKDYDECRMKDMEIEVHKREKKLRKIPAIKYKSRKRKDASTAKSNKTQRFLHQNYGRTKQEKNERMKKQETKPSYGVLVEALAVESILKSLIQDICNQVFVKKFCKHEQFEEVSNDL